MKSIKASEWAATPVKSAYRKFFVELWAALLDSDTPHFYQSRLMCTMACLAELSGHISDVIENEASLAQLQLFIDESFDVVSLDSVLRDIFQEKYQLLFDKLKSFKSKDSVGAVLFRRNVKELKLICDVILSKTYEYMGGLINRLSLVVANESVVGERSKLDEIYALTSSAISHLLWLGYSPYVLSWFGRAFSRKESYVDAEVSDVFKDFFQFLSGREYRFRIYQTFTLSDSSCLSDFFKNSGFDGIDIVSCDAFSMIKRSGGRVVDFGLDAPHGYFVKEIVAKDHCAAVLLFHDALERLKDISAFEYKSDLISCSPKAHVSVVGQKTEYAEDVIIGALRQLFIKKSSIYLDDLAVTFGRFMKNEFVASSFKDSLRKSLHYYRLGVAEATLESKFLAMWIAMESLVECEAASNIDRVVSVVPEMYAFDSLAKRLIYFYRYVESLGVGFDASLLAGVEEDFLEAAQESIENVKMIIIAFRSLHNEDRARELYARLSGSELARYYLCSLREQFSTVEGVKSRLLETSRDVRRQLRRIYAHRNKIVHGGNHALINYKMYSHLAAYVEYLICELLMSAGNPIFPDIESILGGYGLAYEQKLNSFKLKGDGGIDFKDILILDPFW